MTTDFKITAMTPEVLKEKFPEVFAAIETQGYARGSAEGKDVGLKEGHIKGFCSGAESERKRIEAVESQLLVGHEALIAQLKADGKTTGEQAAMLVLGAEREKRKTRMQALEDSSVKPVPPSNTDAEQFKVVGTKDFEVLAKEYVAEHKVSLGKAMIACAKLYPTEHLEFIRKTNS